MLYYLDLYGLAFIDELKRLLATYARPAGARHLRSAQGRNCPTTRHIQLDSRIRFDAWHMTYLYRIHTIGVQMGAWQLERCVAQLDT